MALVIDDPSSKAGSVPSGLTSIGAVVSAYSAGRSSSAVSRTSDPSPPRQRLVDDRDLEQDGGVAPDELGVS
jgi:hypothetical protein